MVSHFNFQSLPLSPDFGRAGKKSVALKLGEETEYRIIVASDRESRERAYRLAYQVYYKEGYVASRASRMIVSGYDTSPETLTLLAEDTHGNDIGTISLVFDSPAHLPCDELYHNEINQLRGQGRKMAEIVRFAVDKDHERSKTILLRLFNFIVIYALRVNSITDFVIEVNPHHVDYYLKMLLFDKAGPERACPRVKGAPAVLLRLDLSVAEDEIRLVGGSYGGKRSHRGRTIYSYAYPIEEEEKISQFLASHYYPMSEEDAIYFGLKSHPNTQNIPGHWLTHWLG